MLASLSKSYPLCALGGPGPNTRDTEHWLSPTMSMQHANAHPLPLPPARGSGFGLQAPQQGKPIPFSTLLTL